MNASREIMKRLSPVAATLLLLFLLTSPLQAKNKNGVGGGGDIVYYTAQSSQLGLSEVQSNGTDSKQLVFRNSEIDVNFANCDYANDGVAGEDRISGVLVLQPESNRSPDIATLTFWFDAELNTGDVATHRLYMTGSFGDATDWPPLATNTVLLYHWEVAPENRKAQRDGCIATGDWSAPIVIEVSHE